MASGGNPRDSATENSQPATRRSKVKRWGKSPPREWQHKRHGKPHQEQCQIGVPCSNARVFEPRGPGLAARGALVTAHPDEWSPKGVRALDRIRLIGLPRFHFSAYPRQTYSGEILVTTLSYDYKPRTWMLVPPVIIAPFFCRVWFFGSDP